MEILAANTILYCDNWQATADFYRTVLGLRETHATDWFVEFALAGAARLSVADESRASIKGAGGSGITLSLQVQDVVSTRQELAAAGAETTGLRDLWGSKVTYLHDPAGHRIELWS